jgi:hypothetical protein
MQSSDPRAIIGSMEDRGILHRIEDDLTDTWIADLASNGVQSIETYLAKHLAFLTFLDDSTAA